MLGRFAPGIRRASGPVPVTADVSYKNARIPIQRGIHRLDPWLRVEDEGHCGRSGVVLNPDLASRDLEADRSPRP